MAKTKNKFDLSTLEIPAPVAKPLYAGVGATDLVVEYVRETVADVQKRWAGVQKDVKDLDFEPKALRDQATSVVNARRAAVEARVAELQDDAQAQADKVTDYYADLAKRGEDLVARIRKQESTKATVSKAKTTSAKAKTTGTQAKKSTKSTAKSAKNSTKSAAKKTSSTAKKSSAPARSSAKATTTAAKSTASNATQAAGDAAEKVGD